MNQNSSYVLLWTVAQNYVLLSALQNNMNVTRCFAGNSSFYQAHAFKTYFKANG